MAWFAVVFLIDITRNAVNCTRHQYFFNACATTILLHIIIIKIAVKDVLPPIL